MHYFGISSNIMSLGGIAIAIGVLVDAGIVMTENVIRHAEQYRQNTAEYRSQIVEITLERRNSSGVRSSSRWRSLFWRSFRCLP